MFEPFIPPPALEKIAKDAGIADDITYARFERAVHEAFSVFYCNENRLTQKTPSPSEENRCIDAIQKQAGKLREKFEKLSHQHGQSAIGRAVNATLRENNHPDTYGKISEAFEACGGGNVHYCADGIIDFLSILETACGDIESFHTDGAQFSNADRLYQWVCSIQNFWEQHMGRDFFLPTWNKEDSQYVSHSGNTAFETLSELAQHLNPVPSDRQLYTAMDRAKHAPLMFEQVGQLYVTE